MSHNAGNALAAGPCWGSLRRSPRPLDRKKLRPFGPRHDEPQLCFGAVPPPLRYHPGSASGECPDDTADLAVAVAIFRLFFPGALLCQSISQLISGDSTVGWNPLEVRVRSLEIPVSIAVGRRVNVTPKTQGSIPPSLPLRRRQWVPQ